MNDLKNDPLIFVLITFKFLVFKSNYSTGFDGYCIVSKFIH